MAGILALAASGHFEIARKYLDTEKLTFSVGDFSISAYKALKSFITIALVFWITAIIADVVESRAKKIRKIRAATRALIVKIIHIAIYIIAFLFTLDIIGINLTSLAVFSGALGIGLGFGLQKIASNFISGLILLLEKSVEEDDLIELPDGTYGFVRKAGARYTLIETLDTKEILVPNEDFITNRVINWTLSSKQGRIEIPVGVSYGSDIDKARDLMLEAAKELEACSKNPEPKCFLRNFGDSSVDFSLFFWIDDITQGRLPAQSEVMFTIWHKFKDNGIEIPFPQRDLHLKTPDTLKIGS